MAYRKQPPSSSDLVLRLSSIFLMTLLRLGRLPRLPVTFLLPEPAVKAKDPPLPILCLMVD